MTEIDLKNYRSFKNLFLPIIYKFNYGKKTSLYKVFKNSNEFKEIEAFLVLDAIEKSGVNLPIKIENLSSRKFNIIEKEKLVLYNPSQK
jgi:hypothetical protein